MQSLMGAARRLVVGVTSCFMLCLTLCLMLWSGSAAAQSDGQIGTLRGVVFSADDEQPLDGVSIAVDGGPATRTNRDGAFEVVLPPGPWILRVDGVPTDPIPVVLGETTEAVVTLARRNGVVEVRVEAAVRVVAATQAIDKRPRHSLSGVITSDKTGKAISGARIFVRGVMEEAETGADGRFELMVPEGAVDVTIIHTAYGTETRMSVPVPGPSLVITMQPMAFDLGVMTITAPRIEGGSRELMDERQKSTEVSDIIGAEQMKRSGDSDAAGALKRVTGVTLVGGRFVYVRGLGERYSSTLLNGAILPSPDPERRVVPLDLFPAGILHSVVIQKTWSPDMPADFGGGVIKLRTRSSPEEFMAKVGLSMKVRLDTTFTGGLMGPSGPGDFFGIDGGFRALPDSVQAASDANPLLERDLFSSQGYTAEELEGFGETMKNLWGTDTQTIPPGMGFGAEIGNRWEFGSLTYGLLATFDFDNDWQRTDEERKIYTVGADGLELAHRYDFDETKNEISMSGILAQGLAIGKHHHLMSTTMVTRVTDNEARIYEGRNRDVGGEIHVLRMRWIERMLITQQLLGSHELSLGGDWDLDLDWRYTFANARRDEPDRRQVRYDYEAGGAFWYLSDRPEGNQRVFSKLSDDSHDLGLDLTFGFRQWAALEARLRVGGVVVIKDRTVDTRRFRFLHKGPISREDEVLTRAPEDIWTPQTIGSDGFQLSEVTLDTDNYTARHRIFGGYAAVDLPLVESLRVSTGLRVEHSAQRVETFEPFDPGAIPRIGELETTDLLPAVTFTWEVAPKMLLRWGWARSVSRPDLRELSPVTFTDVTGGRQIFGNTELDRAVLDHVDLRFEWFPAPGEVLSVGAFYKHFSNPIETVVVPSAQLSVTFDNAPGAHSGGLEFEVRKRLDFIHESLSDLTISANATWIESIITVPEGPSIQTSKERPLQGQSPFVINLQLGYDNVDIGTSVTLLYNVFGRRIVEVGALGAPDTYEEPFHQLDLVFSQKLGAGFSLGFKAKNLIDLPVEVTQGDELTRTWRRGREFSLSLSKSFD